MGQPRFDIRYAPEVRRPVQTLGKRWFGLIRRTVEDRLAQEPETETANRKPLRKPSVLAEAWELRLGPANRFRVFYRVDTAARQVRVLAIGEKRGNRVFIGKEEFEV